MKDIMLLNINLNINSRYLIIIFSTKDDKSTHGLIFTKQFHNDLLLHYLSHLQLQNVKNLSSMLKIKCI